MMEKMKTPAEALRKSKRTIKYIVIHCSATPEGRHHTAKDIDLWHKQRGFSEIGYNYVIQLNGTIELGRDVDKIPAHAENFNKESIGICYIGGCEPHGQLCKYFRYNKSAQPYPTYNKGTTPFEWQRNRKLIKERLIKFISELE